MSNNDLKKAILRKRNPEGYVLERIEEMQEELEVKISEFEQYVTEEKANIAHQLAVVNEKALTVDQDKITEDVFSRIPTPTNGKDADESKIVEAVLGKIRQPEDGEDAVIDEAKIAQMAADLIPYPSKEEIVDLLIPFIPKQDKKEISEITPLEFAEKINTLEEKIDPKSIKGWMSLLKKIQQSLKGGKGSAGGGSGAWHQVNLTGLINSSNKIFTFSGPKPSIYSERVFLNYTEQNPVNSDYTINYQTNTVTYATAPDTSLSGFPHIIRYHA